MTLQAEAITKTYGKKSSVFTALHETSLKINSGESIAITGKSGSGKSTLMHLLATLDRPDSGQLIIDDKNILALSQRELSKLRNQRFGFIFQQFFLNGRQTVLDNVALPLKIAGVGLKERRARALKALEEVDLASKARNKASDLSGGQKQRVCVARALVNAPQVIFADEPTGNLDSENGKRVIDLLFKLNKEKNITLIIVTHDADIAALCDRQLVVKDGRLNEGEQI